MITRKVNNIQNIKENLEESKMIFEKLQGIIEENLSIEREICSESPKKVIPQAAARVKARPATVAVAAKA